MTLVTIDLGDVAGGHHPDDYVTIRAENFRESPGGGITSTAEVVIPLVDGVGQAEVEPGPVVVAFRCQAVADTREKRGVVPETGPVGIEDVIYESFIYTPPVVSSSLTQIRDARDEAVQAVEGEFDEAMDRWFPVETAREGMGLLWDGDGFRWSWLDQFKDTYVDDY